ncbi:protein phosphatase 2C domain-containing protein [Candidatus Micrarchaeota archaeon]|nr:protein phosphatase 2C domain-containing protein [Candidatus Micrarchaeota archaeon]
MGEEKQKHLAYSFMRNGHVNPYSVSRSLYSKMFFRGKAPRKPTPALSSPELLNRVLRYEWEDGYCHSELPGRRYAKDKTDFAIDLVISAEKSIFGHNQENELTPSQEKIIESLKKNARFAKAVQEWNYSEELRIVLEQIDIERRTRDIMNQSKASESVARGLASLDLRDAHEIASKFLNLERESANKLIPAAMEFLGLIPSDRPVFDFVLENIHAIRWVSRKAAEGRSLNSAMNDYHFARSVFDDGQSWTREYVSLRLHDPNDLDLVLQVAHELHEIHTYYDCLVGEYSISEEEARKRSLEDAQFALELSQNYYAGVNSENVPRLKQLCEANPGYTTFNLALEVAMERRMKAEKTRKSELLLPLDDTIRNDELEKLLPGEYNQKTELLREVARTLNHYAQIQTPFIDVPDFYKTAVASLRADYSAAEALRLANELIDVADGKKDETSLPKMDSWPQDYYDMKLSKIPADYVFRIVEHFASVVPSGTAFENALILFRDGQARVRNDVVGDWLRPADSNSCRIVGCYYPSSRKIAGFEDEKTRLTEGTKKFEMDLNLETGCVTIISGWENPSLAYLDGLKIVDPEQVPKKLVFPLPNVSVDKELEEMLAERFPRYVNGAENERNSTVRKVSRTLLAYYHLNSDSPAIAEHYRKILSHYSSSSSIDSEIPVVYRPVIAQLKKQFSLSYLTYAAVELVDERSERSTDTTQLVQMQSPIQLSSEEQDLVLAVLGNDGACTDEVIEQFRNMHPGLREIRLCNFISSRWTEGNFADDIPRYSAAKQSLYEKCHLSGPDKLQKLEAVLDKNNLSILQIEVVSSLFGVTPGALSDEQLRNFYLWMKGPREEREAEWNRYNIPIHHLLDIYDCLRNRRELTPEQAAYFRRAIGKPETYIITAEDYDKAPRFHRYLLSQKEKFDFWTQPTKQQRADLWRRNTQGLFTISDFASRLRFAEKLEYSQEDRRMLEVLYGRNPQAEDVASLKHILIVKSYADDFDDKIRYYYPQVLTLVKQFELGVHDLFVSARRESEYRTLMGFMGIPTSEISASFAMEKGASAAKLDRYGNPKTNEDAFSCIELSDGTVLNAVFDGMGGHDDGSVASDIAKTIFEISAFAGWIQSPEDVRRTMVMADLAIVSAQILMKTQSNDLVECNMGTTAVITMKRGNEFYGVHCGDSFYKVFRELKVVLESKPHDLSYQFQIMGTSVDSGALPRNVVVSALGNATPYLSVNNRESEYRPFILRKGDIEIVASDGITDVMQNDEYSYLFEYLEMNLPSVRNEIMEQALLRKSKNKKYSALHDPSVEIKGKADDRTIILEEHRGETE